MKAKSLILFLLFFIIPLLVYSQDYLLKYQPIITKGEFKKAKLKINEELFKNPKLTIEQKLNLEFEIDKLDRIVLDFTKDQKEILKYIKKYIPNVAIKDLSEWEKEKSLECMVINGKKKYFNNAAQNLFRINKKCVQIKKEFDENNRGQKSVEFDLLNLLKEIIDESKMKNTTQVKPIKYQVDYTVILDSNIIPDGEIVRCWLPYPKEIKGKQENIILLSAFPEKYLVADNSNMQRSIYFEDYVRANKKTEFKISYQYTCYAYYNKIEPDKVKPYSTSTDEYLKYTSEKPPHIVFTKELKELSKKIVGTETNPFLKAKRIFQWISDNIPWASSREYSTIDNISMYALENKHGDCGIQTLLFMTLARMNGIPTHWQSGWEPTTMHDWCYMFIEPYGWVPVDQSFGLKNSDNEEIRWFYLGNFDNRRLVINDDFSTPFYPAKIYPRSETVDFQRGELEWRGGNLFFDKWNYDYNIKEIK